MKLTRGSEQSVRSETCLRLGWRKVRIVSGHRTALLRRLFTKTRRPNNSRYSHLAILAAHIGTSADCPRELLNARHNNDSYTTAGTDGDRLILTQEKESDARKRRSLAARPTSMLSNYYEPPHHNRVQLVKKARAPTEPQRRIPH